MLLLLGCLLAFTAGILTADSWRTVEKPAIPVVPVQKTVTESPPPPSNTGAVIAPPAETSEVVFANGRLRIVPKEVKLRSKRLHYEVELRYPKVAGSKEPHIDNLNRHIRELANESYSSLQSPSKKDLAYYKRVWPEDFNTSELDYEIVLATDSLLSIYLNSYTYIIPAAHSFQTSYVINYDLVARRELKLSDIFKRNSRYLKFIARYCADELSNGPDSKGYLFAEGIPAKTETFKSWNLTRDGIGFNFDACDYMGCAAGKQRVVIPYSVLKPFMKRPLASKAAFAPRSLKPAQVF